MDFGLTRSELATVDDYRCPVKRSNNLAMGKKPQIKACGVIVFRDEPDLSFLLMQHTDRWDLPKGHVDAGESELETALRELEEETGISASDIELDTEFRHSEFYSVKKKRYGDKPRLKELVIFLATLVNDVELELTEHIGFEWRIWDPPHQIQSKSIDPVLNSVADHWATSKRRVKK